MRVRLMHPDRDFEITGEVSPFWDDVVRDLGLDVLLDAMAGNDEFLLSAARSALSSATRNDLETIRYRQAIISDCVSNAAVVRQLYAFTVEAAAQRRRIYLGIFGRYPSSILSNALTLLELYSGVLRKLRGTADTHATSFESKGFTALFSMLRTEFSDEYFELIQNHIATLEFRKGVLLSAGFGPANQGTGYVLHVNERKTPGWLSRLVGTRPPMYTFRIDERDDAGARTLSEMRDRGINRAANATAQAADHIETFFNTLRGELAFYVCCLNLWDKLAELGVARTLPIAHAAGTNVLHSTGIADPSLALRMGIAPVTNRLDADRKSLLIITGANQGGKTSFLRSIGSAQLMMQSGMFVAAEHFEAEVCAGVFTHYRREEDRTMRHGKLDEELKRLSDIVDVIRPDALLLLNESFAATNEREGSQIARQVVSGLVEKKVKVLFVTHLYEFASGLVVKPVGDTLFMRAERGADGTRTFKVAPGEPLETSHAADVYRAVFGENP